MSFSARLYVFLYIAPNIPNPLFSSAEEIPRNVNQSGTFLVPLSLSDDAPGFTPAFYFVVMVFPHFGGKILSQQDNCWDYCKNVNRLSILKETAIFISKLLGNFQY